ncbi:MAG: serine--tRNA ligase [Nitrososphaeraceae archaeon]
MLDSKLLKENINEIQVMLRKRNVEFSLEELVDLDKHRRKLIVELQKFKHKKNKLAKIIATKKRNKETINYELSSMIEIGDHIKKYEKEMLSNRSEFMGLMMKLPNLLHDSVPSGTSEAENIMIRKYGEIDKIKFPPKDHVDIGTNLDLIELERAAKISGARFYFLKNELVRLNLALINFAFDHLSNKGYNLLQTPYMIRKEAMEGAVILEDFNNVIYKIKDEDLYMVGTSEHAMASMHMNEILEGRQLPIRYAGFSPCFRREAGAHGKDMKGIFRVHHFDKVEQFVYSRPEDSWKEHERMLEISEEFYQKLGIPYRVMLLCSSDTGIISSKTYDIEAWLPAQKKFREIVSCSNCTDYQARRLKIRYRDKTNENTKLVHTLNSTLVAIQRTLVAIMENYQTRNGIEIPDALQNYIGGIKEIRGK